MKLTVRDARPEDAAVLVAYNSAMAEETEGKALDPDIIGSGVANLLADRRRGRYWVAESGGDVIGQIMVTYEWSDWRNGNLWWIQSVYVHPDWRRQGVFSALYRHVESLAAAAPDAIGLRLYVEENNTRAQRTYAALGMVKPRYLVMEALFGGGPATKEK
jgi:ribosomal protein S18 acetylase RimI-like enzyme